MMLRLIAASLVIGGAIGLVGSFAFWWAEGVAEAAGLVITVVVGVVVIQRVVLTRHLPRLYAKQVQKLLGRGEAPPAGSAAADPPIVTAWARAVNAGDWDAVAGMLGDDFTVDYPEMRKAFERRRYLKMMRRQRKHFPQLRYVVDEVRRTPEELWVRATLQAPKRRGEPITTEWWEAWRVDEDERRLLGIRQGLVLAVGP